MRIRTKILVITILLMVSLSALAGVASKYIVLDSFVQLENQITGEHVDRVVAAIDDTLRKLESTLGDWANWDDTYDFVAGHHDLYVEENMMDSTFINLDVNMMAFIDTAGSIVYSKSVDLEAETGMPVSASLAAMIPSLLPFLTHEPESRSLSGFVSIDGKPVMFAARPVLTSGREGPTGGTMIMARFLDATKLLQLGKLLRLPLSGCEFNAAPFNDYFREAQDAMKTGGKRFIMTTGPSQIAGYARLDDVSGEPILLVRTVIPRNIYARGLEGVKYFLLSILVVNGLLCLAFLLLLKHHVSDRLVQLGKDVDLVRIQGNSSYRLETTGNDELTIFSQTLNTMLERLKRTQEKLGKASRNEALAKLAGGTAHEFNNILGIIMGSMEALIEKTGADDPRKDLLAKAYAAGERGRGIVNQILVYGRSSQNSLSPSSLAVIVGEALSLINPSVPPNVSMVWHISPDCPQILANPLLVEQLIINICKNAFDAIGQNRGTVETSLGPVTFSQAPLHLPDISPGDYLRLSIRDTGEGMTSSVMEHIFDPFFSTKDVGKGTGLGLSVSRGIMQQHGGWIGVVSKPMEGATFDMIFPLGSANARNKGFDPAEANQQAESGKKTAAFESARLLFIENDPSQYELVATGFGKLDYQVTVVTSGKEALSLIRNSPDSFSLAIVDTSVVDLAWAELCLALGRAAPGLPLILCHWPHDRIDAALADSLGIREFVRKPPSLRLLLQTVQEVLEYCSIEIAK